MPSQSISVPVVFSQVISMGKYSQEKSTVKSPNSTTTTTTSYISSPPIQTLYRKYNNGNNQSVYMSVSSSSSKKTTTTTTRINNNSNNNNNNNKTASAYIMGTSKYSKNNAFEVASIVSFMSITFKCIFVFTAFVLDKILCIILNPFETLVYLLYRIYEIRTMKYQLEELKREKAQFINQSEQLMVQLNACRIINRNVETSYKAMKQKRDILKETNKAIQNELQRERESRYVVEKCHNERIEKLEFEIDMKDQEIMQYEDKERLLKKKIHKLQKKLKKASSLSSSSCLSLPSFSLQNFNTFTFDDPEPSNKESNNDGDNDNTKSEEDIEIYFSENENGNFVFAKDSDAESCTDSSSASEWESESESESESEPESELESDSDSDSNSSIDSDIDAIDSKTINEIPKNSIYYNFGRHQDDTKDEEEEEELELANKVEQNPVSAMRQEAYNCLYQSIVSELCSSSILMDLDVKLDKNNINSYTCISIILEALINYLETKNQLINTEAIDEIFIRYRALILNYTDTEEDQMNLLVALENICIESSLRLQQHLRILMAIYKAELIDPNIIIKWYRLLPDSEDSSHRSCPMTPSIYCVLPKLQKDTSTKVLKRSNSFTEGDCRSFGHMIDGHYATNAIPCSLEDNANIYSKSEGIENVNTKTKTEIKVSQNNHNHEESLESVTKSKSKNGGRSGHARTASGSILRRKRSSSNASDSNHEIYYLRLRKDIRELAKVFALWLESKECSSSDEESILDNMSMSQDFESDSEDGGISGELRRIHRKLLSDEDSCETNSNSNSYGMEEDESSEIDSVETYNNQNLSEIAVRKCCKRVTFNLSHMEDKDEAETVNNEEEDVNNQNTYLNENENSSLMACIENNPLNFNQFEFDEDTDEEGEEEIIEEVEEVIEEEEIIEEEIIEEETINGDEENEENLTIIEEKEEVIDEVVECIKIKN